MPNLFRIVANSPAALEGYLGFSGALGKGALAAQTRERIALAIAEVNDCGYCLSAHTYIARNLAKLDDAEITANRSGASNDVKADAAVRFAVTLAQGARTGERRRYPGAQGLGILRCGDRRNHRPCRAQHLYQLRPMKR